MRCSGARARPCVVGNGGQKSGREATARGNTQNATTKRSGTGSAGQRPPLHVEEDRAGLGLGASPRGSLLSSDIETGVAPSSSFCAAHGTSYSCRSLHVGLHSMRRAHARSVRPTSASVQSDTASAFTRTRSRRSSLSKSNKLLHSVAVGSFKDARSQPAS